MLTNRTIFIRYLRKVWAKDFKSIQDILQVSKVQAKISANSWTVGILSALGLAEVPPKEQNWPKQKNDQGNISKSPGSEHWMYLTMKLWLKQGLTEELQNKM